MYEICLQKNVYCNMCILACMYHIVLILLHFGCFCLLATVNNAFTNMGVQTSLQDAAFNFGGCMPRSRIAESYGSSIFNFGGIYHTIF